MKGLKKAVSGIAVLALLGLIVISCGSDGGSGILGGGGGGGGAIIVTPLATGQTECFDAVGATISCTNTGQDGELKKGIAWPTPRFTNNGDGTVTDNLTGLMWLKDANCIASTTFDNDGTANDGRVTWQHALDFTKRINDGTYSNCRAGHTDWRLPNKEELRSLINNASDWNHAFLETEGFFDNVQEATYYWSNTTRVANPIYAQAVEFLQGMMGGIEKNFGCFVWPVRLATTKLLRTGQTECYNESGDIISCAGTGQDGELQTGVAWPSTRFSANPDTTVTDTLTGLIWASDGNIMPSKDSTFDNDDIVNDGKVTWQHALDYVAKLNTDGYLGHNDWRLPNINELKSLLKEAPTSPAAWLNSQGFSNVQQYEHWSSTSRFHGRIVSMATGTVYVATKNQTYFVWPVRGGQ